MAILGGDKVANLEFFESHYPVWLVAPATIGLSALQAGDMKTRTNDCRTAYGGMLAARETAKNATQVFYDRYTLMMNAGRDDIRLIKAFADSQANPMTVYTAAQLPPPAQPGPAPVPTAPTEFKVGLNPDGSVTLKWKGIGDGNTFWLVQRRLGGAAAFTQAGGSGVKSYTDATIPAGTSSIEYRVFGQRGGVSGPESVVVGVRFGGGGAGFAVMNGSVAVEGDEAAEARLAA